MLWLILLSLKHKMGGRAEVGEEGGRGCLFINHSASWVSKVLSFVKEAQEKWYYNFKMGRFPWWKSVFLFRGIISSHWFSNIASKLLELTSCFLSHRMGFGSTGGQLGFWKWLPLFRPKAGLDLSSCPLVVTAFGYFQGLNGDLSYFAFLFPTLAQLITSYSSLICNLESLLCEMQRDFEGSHGGLLSPCFLLCEIK